ncbi:transposase [Cupriavidus alkaliphilus]|uniref:Transposase n=1 Tax=Cupriavidus alkaliphilus TaxID=942866 RepID=A0A7W4VCZ8_9BURK|nr:transposase [Cupriavidus alkaliphilus]
MRKPETITMTMRELDRLKVIQAVVDHGLPVWRAAEKLGLSRRQVERLVLRYREDGPSGPGSRKLGRSSNNRLSGEREAAALGLIREHFADFGPTLAAEKLRKAHGLTLAKETVRRLMMAAGLWVPRKQRPPKVYQPRNRRACRYVGREAGVAGVLLPLQSLVRSHR